jgi:branched-chain amino acid transport system substrate-binding protein
MHRYLKIFVGLCFLLLMFKAAICAAQIKIGFAGPLTDPYGPFGVPSQRAVQIAVAQYNVAGGVNGESLLTVSKDDGCNPAQAAIVADEMVAEDVAVVVGHICSGATQAALDVYAAADLVAISPASTNPDLTYNAAYPRFLRTVSPDDVQAAMQVQFVLDTLQLSDIALVHDGDTYPTNLASTANSLILQSGQGNVVLYASIAAGGDDYSQIVSDIDASNAEIVIFSGYEPEASKILNEMRGQGLPIPFLSCDAVFLDSFIVHTGANAEGTYLTSSPDISTNSIARQAAAIHLSLYGEEPGPSFYNAYAAAICLIEAIDRANSTDAASLLGVLKSQSFSTPIGATRFNEKGDVIGLGYAVYQVQGGQFVEIFDAVDAFAGNFDKDGDVDGVDMKTVAENFNHTGCAGQPSCGGDFDSDGDVDEDDLIVFSVYFGR